MPSELQTKIYYKVKTTSGLKLWIASQCFLEQTDSMHTNVYLIYFTCLKHGDTAVSLRRQNIHQCITVLVKGNAGRGF